jgi:c-di-GMP-binding flagellar brake protein YcgR
MRLAGRLAGRVAHPVTLLDVSLTGCLVQCGALLDHGAILDLTIDIGGPPLDAKVRVAEACVDGAAPETEPRYLAGLEFLGLTPRATERLRRFLDEERRRRQRADAPAQ